MILRTQKKEKPKQLFKKIADEEIMTLRDLLEEIVERELKQLQENELKLEVMEQKYLELLAYK